MAFMQCHKKCFEGENLIKILTEDLNNLAENRFQAPSTFSIHSVLIVYFHDGANFNHPFTNTEKLILFHLW